MPRKGRRDPADDLADGLNMLVAMVRGFKEGTPLGEIRTPEQLTEAIVGVCDAIVRDGSGALALKVLDHESSIRRMAIVMLKARVEILGRAGTA